jgi:hypothetical protein
LKCHFHPRAQAVAVCSACGLGLCRRCVIEDRGHIYCDGCYASEDSDDGNEDLVHAGETVESEDYIDLELMDLLDTDEDDGLF